MNAIVSLCHFCELHGPSVLFCTQSFHSHDPQHMFSGDNSLEDSGSYYSRDRRTRSPAESVSSSTETQTPHHTQPTKSSDFCEACQSLAAGEPGFISNDHEAKVSYVSSQHPDHPQAFSMVRQACVQSLSCEVCPGREGPIFFGDKSRGHVLSHTFFIKDSQARGFQRWYSIIVVMMDKIYLLNSWPFLVTHMRKVIDQLQKKADVVYEEEQTKCPQRSVRLTYSMTPSNFRQKRGVNKAGRSLVELTNDKSVFQNLHQLFSWILRACGNRLTEKLLEGPPTEDSIIDLEKQEETEEGFMMVYTTKVEVEQEVVPPDHSEEAELACSSAQQAFSNIRHVLKVLGNERFHMLAHHVVIGNQIIIRCDEKLLVKSFINALKTLLPHGCCRVVTYSQTYEDSWRCNFLGLPSDTPLPSHVVASGLFVVVDVNPPRHRQIESFYGYEFIILPGCELCDRGPAVLMKMERLLMNEHLEDGVVESGLVCLKEEWMNKVKVLFKFTKAGGNRSEEDTHKLMTILGAQDVDRHVLKFWMTGLSVQYRTHMLSATMQQSVANN